VIDDEVFPPSEQLEDGICIFSLWSLSLIRDSTIHPEDRRKIPFLDLLRSDEFPKVLRVVGLPSFLKSLMRGPPKRR